MEILQKLASFAFALGILIAFHELGHYLVARSLGVKVLRFSLGFGRPLVAWRSGADRTEWAIAAFPLGGYVKMLDETEGEVAAHERHRAFNRQSVGKRFAIVSAGPVANFLLAILLYWLLFVVGVPGLKPIIAAPPAGSAASAAGFKAEERIVSVDGEAVASWQDFRWVMLDRVVKRAHAEIEVRDARDYVAQHVLDLSQVNANELERDFLGGLGLSPFRAPLAPVFGRVQDSGAAHAAGLRSGDEVVAVDGQPIGSWQALVDVVRANPRKRLTFAIQRGDARLDIAVTPAASDEGERVVGRPTNAICSAWR